MRRLLSVLCLLGLVTVAAAGSSVAAKPGSGPLGVSPARVNFGQVVVGAKSDEVPVSVTNTSTATWLVSSWYQDGPFSVTGFGCPYLTGWLYPNESCTFWVQFEPTLKGHFRGTVGLHWDGVGSTTATTAVSVSGGAR